ncbi:NADH-quinone oxidoreductase subunit N [Frigoriglobus tundricola]|uniref:NADH-quinone oxidoreductase subunit N n=1 Tax=Frigoriglobus tundricola TaxID=2774151 RepID=A0A6M5Z1L3_9BACT|nr:NADH-quinone oxidoreductase subunit N [Frigoriglobus tundricola]QJW99704.1 NADH-ubiquinone oxidoreductase chain N [Frigoriglobus tundricola]
MFPTLAGLETLRSALDSDLLMFLPELAVCTGIVVLLLARLVPAFDRAHLGGAALVALVAALFAGGYQVAEPQWAGPYFGNMLTSDAWSGFVRIVVLAAALLTVLLTLLTGIPDAPDSADFYVLLLGGTLGMMLMTSASHLLMAFIAVEMASLPGYALAGFLKGKRTGSEAALKYVVYGAAASGVMLYGITLLAGTFGSGALHDVAAGVAARGLDLPVLAGLAFTFVGLGFKLAAVPFQFWCPDVFEGAAAEVAGFLSVASKAGAIGLTGRVLLSLHSAHEGSWAVPATVGVGVAVGSVLTVTLGNLAAFGQNNLKRLLAYSTIAHAGYMLMGLAVATKAGAAAVLFYLSAYVAMNLGAFGVVALVRNATGSEDLRAFRGLVQRNPLLAIAMTVFLGSLLGLPPVAGFAGKFQVFASVYGAARAATAGGPPGLGTVFYVLLGVGAVNTAASAYYYLKIVRAMLLEDPEGEPSPVRLAPAAGLFLFGLVAALFVAGVWWDPLAAETSRAASAFGVK